MAFNSLAYAAFLPAVMLAAWSLRSARSQNSMLLVASWLFYAAWDWRFLSLLIVSTVVDHRIGLALGRTADERRRRQLLAASLVTNLGILATFKYFDFFVGSAGVLIEQMGLTADLPTLGLVLPVGISFYTFQTISYTFDVYRRELEPESSIVTFGLYVSFFPQLVAGPIERGRRLLPALQVHRPRPDPERIVSGLMLIVLGLWKKVAIADAMAPVVTRAFDDVATADWTLLLIGAWAFTIQIYGDFSGYTDIARGSARLLGVELMQNFQEPWLSRSVTEFWRTWHISLSTWLRDYLYVPLGGNRSGRVRTYRNLLLVMLIGGLWHGAGWTFVAWGAGHGLWLAVERLVRDRRGEPDRSRWPLAKVVMTFHGVVLLFVVFRAPSIEVAGEYVARLLSLGVGTGPSAGDVVLVVGALAALLVLDIVRRHGPPAWSVPGQQPALQGAVVGFFALTIVIWSSGAPAPFIYFQF